MAITRLTGFPTVPDNPNLPQFEDRGLDYGDFVTGHPEIFGQPGEQTANLVPDSSSYEEQIQRRGDLPQLTPTLEHPRITAEREAGNNGIDHELDYIHMDAMEHSPYGGLREAAELGRQIVYVDELKGGKASPDRKFLFRGQLDAWKLQIIRGEVPQLRSFFNKRPGASLSPRELCQLQEWVQMLEGNFKPARIPDPAAPTPEPPASTSPPEDTGNAPESADGKGGKKKGADAPTDAKGSGESAAETSKKEDPAASKKKPGEKDPATQAEERLQQKADAAANKPFEALNPNVISPVKAEGTPFLPPSSSGASPKGRPQPWWSTRTSIDYTKDPFIRLEALPDGSPEKGLAGFVLASGMMGGLGLRGIDGELCATDLRFFYEQHAEQMPPMMQKTWMQLWNKLDYAQTQTVKDPHEEPGPEVVNWYQMTHAAKQ